MEPQWPWHFSSAVDAPALWGPHCFHCCLRPPSWYAQQGYLVLVLDVRGRGDSGGEFSGFATEDPDGDDALAWLKEHPLCNGRVGSYGFSYQGLTQLLGSDNNLLPDALAPAMCGLDERLHWASEGGAHWWVLSLSWGLQLAAESCRRRGDQQAWQTIKDCLASGQQSRMASAAPAARPQQSSAAVAAKQSAKRELAAPPSEPRTVAPTDATAAGLVRPLPAWRPRSLAAIAGGGGALELIIGP